MTYLINTRLVSTKSVIPMGSTITLTFFLFQINDQLVATTNIIHDFADDSTIHYILSFNEPVLSNGLNIQVLWDPFFLFRIINMLLFFSNFGFNIDILKRFCVLLQIHFKYIFLYYLSRYATYNSIT